MFKAYAVHRRALRQAAKTLPPTWRPDALSAEDYKYILETAAMYGDDALCAPPSFHAKVRDVVDVIPDKFSLPDVLAVFELSWAENGLPE